jgi:hypothetical protein
VKANSEQRIRRILQRLADPGAVLRGSLLHRNIRHARGCRTCTSGGGHPTWILATSYPGRKIHHLTLPPEQVPLVRRNLANYRKLQKALAQICEINRQQLRQAAAQDQAHD